MGTEVGEDGEAKAGTSVLTSTSPTSTWRKGRRGSVGGRKKANASTGSSFGPSTSPSTTGTTWRRTGSSARTGSPGADCDREEAVVGPEAPRGAGQQSTHPRTCDPNWSSFYSEHHVHLPSWVKACSIHFETFCRQTVDGVPRWRRDDKVGKICRAWVRGRQVSGKDLKDETKVKAKTSENLLLRKMCARANLPNSLAGEMLSFCNERVSEDCVGGKHHCPRWKTNKWREFCENDLGSHFPVQHDRLVWKYRKEHPLDPA